MKMLYTGICILILLQKVLDPIIQDKLSRLMLHTNQHAKTKKI